MSQTRPSCRLSRLVLAFGALLGVETAAHAQLPQARLYSIFPCGAKAGTTVEVTVTSFADLDALDRLVFNTPGITAVPKMQTIGAQKKPVPNVFEITIRPDVPTGVYEVAAGGLYGLSNPRIFVVGSHRSADKRVPRLAEDCERKNFATS